MTDSESLVRIDNRLQKMDREQTSIAASARHLTDHLADLHEDVRHISGSLNGPDGVIAQLGRTQEQVKGLWKAHEECGARKKHEANSTAASGRPAVHNAPEILACYDAKRERAKAEIAREKTKQERLRFWATAIGIALSSGGAGYGVSRAIEALTSSTPPAHAAPALASPAP
jgi:uncharacterized protein YoxC